MANGWARDGAVQEQIDDTVADAVKLARLRLAEGEGSDYCEDCGERIPETRRKALPGSRSDEHTSELQSLMRISYAVYCLKNNITPEAYINARMQSKSLTHYH